MKRRAWLILLAAGVLIITGAAFFMGMRWKIDWEAANFVESDKFLANRERGFYNMRGIRISDDSPVSGEILEEIMREQPEETLELLQIHIGTYRDREISSSGVDQIRRIFRAYAEKEKRAEINPKRGNGIRHEIRIGIEHHDKNFRDRHHEDPKRHRITKAG